MSLPSFNLIGQQTTELLQGLCFLNFQSFCFQTFQNVEKYSSGCHDNQVSIFRRWVLTYIMSLPMQVSTWLASKQQKYCRVFVFSLFRVFVFRLFKMLGNTGMVAKATKFLYLEDESWPKLCLYLVSTWLASKQQKYCRVFVFSLFRVFVFRLFKMLGNTSMVAKATKFLYLEDDSWPK